MQNDELELESEEETTEETTQKPDQQEELELDSPESKEEPSEATEGTKSDPLDEIQDMDELRREAKKHRAIAQRHKKKEVPKEVPKETPKESKETSKEYLKKSDFELANQKKAIRLATVASDSDSDEIKTAKADILENWNEVRQFYTPRRGKDTPEDIFEDIKDAYTVFNTRRVKTEKKPDTSELTTTKVAPTGNSPVKTQKKDPPNFHIPKKPDEWY